MSTGYVDAASGVWMYGEDDRVVDTAGDPSFSGLLNKGQSRMRTVVLQVPATARAEAAETAGELVPGLLDQAVAANPEVRGAGVAAVAWAISQVADINEAIILDVAVGQNEQVMDVRDWGTGALVPSSPAAAAANTAKIQAALDSTLYRRVYVPSGEWYVNPITVPTNKELYGDYSRAYTTRPTTGTRLRCPSAAQTAPMITLHGRSKLTSIGVFGAGGDAVEQAIVQIATNGPIIRDCALGFGRVGIEGDYKLAHIESNHIYANRGPGIRDILDGMVRFNTININGGHGIYAGNGASAVQYIGNRIEWNVGCGILLYGTQQVSVIGNLIDRNGSAGLRLQGNQKLTVQGNQVWRNGKLAQDTGVADDDCNIQLSNNIGFSLLGNVTRTGEDDGGGGYNSPLYAVRTFSNTDGVVIGNDLNGGNTGSWRRLDVDVRVARHSNLLKPGESEVFLGDAALAVATLNNVPAASSATTPLALPPLSTYSVGRVYTVDITSRNDTLGYVRSATFKLVATRPFTADAGVLVAGITNLGGASFGTAGTEFILSATASADASTITLAVQNTTAGQVSFLARIR